MWQVQWVYYSQGKTVFDCVQKFGDCGHKHRSIDAAKRCLAHYKKLEMSNTDGQTNNVWLKLI